MPEMELDEKALREWLHYEPDTGIFRWRKKFMPNGQLAKPRAGSKKPARKGSPRDYWKIAIFRKTYNAHRLAWLYMTGEWPTGHIDHIDGDGLNNRWANLRLADQCSNQHNARLRRDNATGFKGVHRKGARFAAQIRVRGETIWLGSRKTAEDAYALYVDAARKHHGEFARVA